MDASFSLQLSKKTTNFHYTRCITPKRVTSLRGPSPRHSTTYGQPSSPLSKKCRSGGEPLATLCLTSLGFEPQLSHSRDDRVIASPIERFSLRSAVACFINRSFQQMLTCNALKIISNDKCVKISFYTRFINF